MEPATAVAHALAEDFDIMKAFPNLGKIPINRQKRLVDLIVHTLYDQMTTAIEKYGKSYLESGDVEGLTTMMIHQGVQAPKDMLLKMNAGILKNIKVDARHILDYGILHTHDEKGNPFMIPERQQLCSVWWVKMEV